MITSTQYWDNRYKTDRRGSGSGSRGKLAEFKAEVLNDFITAQDIKSVVELGCGEGPQLKLYTKLPKYLGLDVSPTAIAKCQEIFAGDPLKTFKVYVPGKPVPKSYQADLALSIDVLFHLWEPEIFQGYLDDLGSLGTRYLIVYASDVDVPYVKGASVYRRKFTPAMAKKKDWVLESVIPQKYPYDARNENGTSMSDFYIYRRA